MRGLVCAWLVVSTSLFVAPAWGEAELATPVAEDGPEAAPSTSPAAEPGSVSRSTFTTAIVDREPQDDIKTLTNDQERIFYFTELRDFEGTTVTHRWEYEGEPVAEVYFQVGGPRWRVYSSKNLPADKLGEWSVSVVDENNQVLKTEAFLFAVPPGGLPPGSSDSAAGPEATPPPAAEAPEAASPTSAPPQAASPSESPADAMQY